MEETKPKFDARLKEGVAYFEQMLKVMPDDRTTLEFLAVAYLQLNEPEKADQSVVALARVLLKEGDVESATALLPRLEACPAPEAQAMVLKVKAAGAPRPDLTPEVPREEPVRDLMSIARESEAKLAEKLGEKELAEHLRALPDNGRPYLVSALAALEKEKPDVCEKAISRLADEFGEPPIPLDIFDLDHALAERLPEGAAKVRGVIPFARLGGLVLVSTLSPHDTALKRSVTEALGAKTRFYLAEPRMVETALAKLYPEDAERNA